MSIFAREREIITRNEFIDNFDFAEIEEFIKNADKNLFISHRFRNSDKMLVQPRG